jgi:hypothetical protein
VNTLATKVSFDDVTMWVELADGRAIGVPLEWFPDLEAASAKDRKNWELIGGGLGIRWEALDEDVSVESLLRLR